MPKLSADEILDRAITSNRTHRLKSELDSLKQDDRCDNSRINHIQKILEEISKESTESTNKNSNFVEHKQKMKDAMYKKRWHYLTLEQKLNRLDEYLSRILMDDLEIKNKLISMIKLNTLKSQDIEYKMEIGKIFVIKSLSVEDGKFVLNDSKSKPKSEPEPEAEVEPDPKADPNADPKPEQKSKPKTKTKPKK